MHFMFYKCGFAQIKVLVGPNSHTRTLTPTAREGKREREKGGGETACCSAHRYPASLAGLRWVREWPCNGAINRFLVSGFPHTAVEGSRDTDQPRLTGHPSVLRQKDVCCGKLSASFLSTSNRAEKAREKERRRAVSSVGKTNNRGHKKNTSA